MFTLTLTLQLVPSKKLYKKLNKEFEKIKKTDPTLTWERFEVMLSERVLLKRLVKAAKAAAKDYTKG